MQLVLKHGIYHVSQNGDTVLLYSIKHDNYNKFAVILAAGADMEAKDKVSSGLSKEVGCRG